MSIASKFLFDPIKEALSALVGGSAASDLATVSNLEATLNGVVTTLVADGVSTVMNLIPAAADPIKAAVLGDVIVGLQAEQAKLQGGSLLNPAPGKTVS